MSQWGVFRITDSDALHIAPCDKDGFSLSPHIMAEYCLCKPRLQEGLWVHQYDGSPPSGGADGG
jgi:hypothetical protein